MKKNAKAGICICAAATLMAAAAGSAQEDPKAIKPTEEHPVPNVLQVTGKKRFFVSYRYFIRNWALLGVWKFNMLDYENEHCKGHTAVEPVKDEATLKPRIGKEVDGRKWLVYSVPNAQERHYVDLTQFYNGIPNFVLCYAAADLYCPEEIPNAVLYFGCADSAKVYLNGKLVHTYDEKRRAAEPDTDKVPGLAMNKGWNLLLIKVGNIMHGAGMYARFADADGNPINVEAPEVKATEAYTPPPAPPAKGKEAASLDLKGEWKVKADPEAVGRSEHWEKPELNDADWKTLKVPGEWEATLDLRIKGAMGYYALASQWFPTSQGLYNGIGWVRRKVTVPADWKGKGIFLEMGTVSDWDWTYFNGAVIGVTDYAEAPQEWWKVVRRYRVPEQSIKFGAENTIAVQIWDCNSTGGIMGPEVRLVAEEL